MTTTLYIIIVDRGPVLLPKRYGYATRDFAVGKATYLAWIHGAKVDTRGDANATVLYIDASDFYTRAHN